MNIQARPFRLSDSNAWDNFVAHSWNGTFLHTRRFLSYHGDRFRDASLVLEDEKQCIVGVFPAAIDREVSDQVVSHPGLTYGGLVHCGALWGKRMGAAFHSIREAYRLAQIHMLCYKAIPYIYHRAPAADDVCELFLQGATRYWCALSATIDLANRPLVNKGRRYQLKKALKSNIQIARGPCYFGPFWHLLADNLWMKYRVRPVHSITEIQQLYDLFPTNIECVVAVLDGEVIAGVVLFHTDQVAHVQYMSANSRGKALSALDLIIESSIERAKDVGMRYFNFGTSNEGMQLNHGIHQFKRSFGAGSVPHEFYKVKIL